MRRKKIRLGNQQASSEPALDESAVKRGYQLSQTTAHLFQSVAGAGASAVDPKILAAAGLALVFLFVSFLFGASDPPDEIRGRIPALREQTIQYLTARLGADQQTRIDQRWQSIERQLQEIAHNRQLQDWNQMRLKIDELLLQESDGQSPAHQFCLELRKQMPAE